MTYLQKIYIVIALMLSALAVSAQSGVGNWNIHSVFSEKIINIIDTGDLVYYLADGNLFYYDKKTDESGSLSRNNKLNDVSIKQIYYNYDARYLMVIYNSSNIDVVYPDGTVTNAPDIYHADIDPKSINDVSFKNNRVYLATDFGFVILNDDKDFEVIESQNHGEATASIVEVGNFIIVGKSDGAFLSPKSLSMHTPSSFKQFHTHPNPKFNNINDSTILLDEGWTYRYVFDDEGVKSREVVAQSGLLNFAKNSEGFIASSIWSPRKMLKFDVLGKCTEMVQLPEDMSESIVTTAETDGSIWELSTKGVRHLALEGSEVSTIYADYFKYNSSSVTYPQYLCFNEALGKLYVMDCGPGQYYSDYMHHAQINTLENGFWKNITPEKVPTIGTYTDGYLRGIYTPVFDPDDPETFWIGSWFEGVYKIKNNEVVEKYDWTNTPLAEGWAPTVNCLWLDKKKNLWAFFIRGNKKFYVLPREKQSGTPSADDWIEVKVSIPETASHKTKMLVTRDSEIKLIITGSMMEQLLIFNDNGNPASANIPSIIFTSGNLIDQDEKPFAWERILCFIEDANGKVWLGTTNGVIEMNPANAFSSGFRINRIKVPRNDGTNYADYLLSGTTVTAMATDGANRKWIGTLNMGLYLVSADGSQILKHFNTSNSPLLSDNIISITCNPTNNTVYVGTPLGLLEYYSDAAPAAESYSEIYAYPNPVTPEYSGNIIITGLMENSLVKIADSGGKVIRSIQSTGGMASWDGCYQSGERVKTGVYYVLASSNENGSSSGVVTKILFIK